MKYPVEPVREDDETVGTFLAQKAENMKRWLEGENVLVPFEPTPLRATLLANELAKHNDLVESAAFEPLIGMLREVSGASELVECLEAVQSREDLHPKFWRYIQLFVETVSSP